MGAPPPPAPRAPEPAGSLAGAAPLSALPPAAAPPTPLGLQRLKRYDPYQSSALPTLTVIKESFLRRLSLEPHLLPQVRLLGSTVALLLRGLGTSRCQVLCSTLVLLHPPATPPAHQTRARDLYRTTARLWRRFRAQEFSRMCSTGTAQYARQCAGFIPCQVAPAACWCAAAGLRALPAPPPAPAPCLGASRTRGSPAAAVWAAAAAAAGPASCRRAR